MMEIGNWVTPSTGRCSIPLMCAQPKVSLSVYMN
jgi:hypothetical protein